MATLPRQSSPEGLLLVVSSFSLLPKLMIVLGAWLWIHCPLSRSGCNATLDRVAARIHILGTSDLFISSWDMFSVFLQHLMLSCCAVQAIWCILRYGKCYALFVCSECICLLEFCMLILWPFKQIFI